MAAAVRARSTDSRCYGVPDDLLTVDFGEVYPELKNMRLRGRVDGKRVVPYYTRAEIQNGKGVNGRELVWVDDAVDLFFLQIQGSGKVTLDSGETVRLSFAEQNGHPYRSVGRLLVERGELTLDQASMQGIRAWGNRNPDKLPELLNSNASYVFFREQPGDSAGPGRLPGCAAHAGQQPGGGRARSPTGSAGVLEHHAGPTRRSRSTG